MPTLTPEQRAVALRKAAEARAARAALKEELKAGPAALKDALARAHDDEVVGKLKVVSALEALPGVGKVKARAIMADVGITESRRLRGLGPKQVAALLAAIS